MAEQGGTSGQAPLRALVVTKLFPNAALPTIAPFNRQQFAALARLCDVQLLATLPWFPGAGLLSRWSASGRTVDVPRTEEIDGLLVRHPRVLYVPKVGHALAPALYAASLLPRVQAFRGRVDVVLASWAYPDGVAGVWLAKLLGVPAVVKVHGSDIDVLAETWWGRTILGRVLPTADRIVGVSRPLCEKVVALGAPGARVALVRNGVDRGIFRLQDRAAARAALGEPAFGTSGKWIVYVGRLHEEKGMGDLVSAFERVAGAAPDARLVLVGDGPELARCREAAARLPGRILVAGGRPLREVATFMAAADLVTLPSWHEGTPNVLLEALACGRRIVATDVGGIPDVVTSPALGRLVPAKQPEALAEALRAALEEPYSPAALAAAAPPDWSESARALFEVLRSVAAPRPAPAGAEAPPFFAGAGR